MSEESRIAKELRQEGLLEEDYKMAQKLIVEMGLGDPIDASHFTSDPEKRNFYSRGIRPTVLT